MYRMLKDRDAVAIEFGGQRQRWFAWFVHYILII